MRIEKKDLNTIDLFQQEKDKFYIISLIATAEHPQMISDLENYIIARSEVGFPIWIWTKDNIEREKCKEIEMILEELYESGENQVTCKKEFYDFYKERHETTSSLEIGFFTCEEVTKPSKGKGVFVKPNYEDKVTLAEFWRQSVKETNLSSYRVSQQEALEEVERWLEEKNFFVLRDHLGDIVSMAGYGTVDDMAKITHVYTDREERGKGYCQYLIYSLTKKLLEDGYKPLLYTKHNYEASNKAYQNVGFMEKDVLISYTIQK